MDIRTRLTVGAGAVIVVLTAAAFWLSYAHLQEVADAHGLDGARSWAWPATLDLFIIAGEVLMLVAALKGQRDAWAILLTVAGSVGSIGLNVYGVGSGAPVIEYIVAAVPPTAALLAFGALMRQIHVAVVAATEREEKAQEPVSAPVEDVPAQEVDEATEEPEADTQALQEAVSRAAEDLAAASVGASVLRYEAEEVTPVRVASAKPTVKDIAAAVEDIQAEGKELSGAVLAAYFGVSDRTGRRYLNHYKDAFAATA